MAATTPSVIPCPYCSHSSEELRRDYFPSFNRDSDCYPAPDRSPALRHRHWRLRSARLAQEAEGAGLLGSVAARQSKCRNERGPAANAQFLINAVQMNFDGAFTHTQCPSDRFIRKSITDQSCDLPLSVG
jgi:hypothetical protein